jgi:hypothetical protein
LLKAAFLLGYKNTPAYSRSHQQSNSGNNAQVSPITY